MSRKPTSGRATATRVAPVMALGVIAAVVWGIWPGGGEPTLANARGSAGTPLAGSGAAAGSGGVIAAAGTDGRTPFEGGFEIRVRAATGAPLADARIELVDDVGQTLVDLRSDSGGTAQVPCAPAGTAGVVARAEGFRWAALDGLPREVSLEETAALAVEVVGAPERLLAIAALEVRLQPRLPRGRIADWLWARLAWADGEVDAAPRARANGPAFSRALVMGGRATLPDVIGLGGDVVLESIRRDTGTRRVLGRSAVAAGEQRVRFDLSWLRSEHDGELVLRVALPPPHEAGDAWLTLDPDSDLGTRNGRAALAPDQAMLEFAFENLPAGRYRPSVRTRRGSADLSAQLDPIEVRGRVCADRTVSLGPCTLEVVPRIEAGVDEDELDVRVALAGANGRRELSTVLRRRLPRGTIVVEGLDPGRYSVGIAGDGIACAARLVHLAPGVVRVDVPVGRSAVLSIDVGKPLDGVTLALQSADGTPIACGGRVAWQPLRARPTVHLPRGQYYVIADRPGRRVERLVRIDEPSTDVDMR